MANEDRVDKRYADKKITYLLFFVSQRVIRANYLVFRAKKTFNFLLNVFIQASVFFHLNLKYNICIESDVSSYAIHRILSWLTLVPFS